MTNLSIFGLSHAVYTKGVSEGASVNLVYDENLRGTATMSAIPYRGQGAVNAIDGDTGIHHPCTSIDVSGEYEHVWWKVWMQRTFNVAELKIYFEATSCDATRYNERCSHVCDRRCLNQHCDTYTGECIYGCSEAHRSGPYCAECDNRHYLSDCSGLCGHCKNGGRCHNITGNCIHGCQSNWQEPFCRECDDKHFKRDCSGLCGHCKNGDRCHNITGNCTRGCQPNWQKPFCQVCSPYKYGPNCVFDCGHCKDGRPCSTGNGSCLNSCEEGWRGALCLMASSESVSRGLTDVDKSPVTGLYVAIGVLATLLAITFTVLAYLIRQQRYQPSPQHDNKPPLIFVNHREMVKTHGYDKPGVRDADNCLELLPAVTDYPQEKEHVTDSDYIHAALRFNLVLNSSLRGNATMNEIAFYGQGAFNAIDGDTGVHKPCAAMDVSGGYGSIWWKVWLQKIVNIAELKIYFQPATIYRSTGFSIYVYDNESYIPPSDVSGRLVYQHDPTTGCPPSRMTIVVNRTAQGIAYYNTRQRAINSPCIDKSPDIKVVVICEVVMLHGMVEIARMCVMKAAKTSNVMYTMVNVNMAVVIRIGMEPIVQNVIANITRMTVAGYVDTVRMESDVTTSLGIVIMGVNQIGRDLSVERYRVKLLYPILFIECDSNHYNSDCSGLCGHCKDGELCHSITGHCIHGCRPNWQGPLCRECEVGFYGPGCSQSCGHCKTGTLCNNVTGTCPTGCKDQWSGSKCDVCSSYKYGPNCKLDCGHCKDGRPCSAENGSCTNGCKEGWKGISCLTALTRSDRLGVIKTDNIPATGLYVTIGVLSTVFVISVILNGVLLRIVRKQGKHSPPPHDSQPQYSVNHIQMEETHAYDKLGVRSIGDYQELSPVVTDQPPEERHLSDSNYINSTLR
ncbi:uncharacterized protein LOC125660814 [Ostrea edulis]|uniref:uncharacterized protein LOC125660814 n=1 Tax=Ostrea edulis TaxID=37623 RepID=UPI0024AFA749|nr:uncharacterized protein LOC125660814 [Ostrea edulis]